MANFFTKAVNKIPGATTFGDLREYRGLRRNLKSMDKGPDRTQALRTLRKDYLRGVERGALEMGSAAPSNKMTAFRRVAVPTVAAGTAGLGASVAGNYLYRRATGTGNMSYHNGRRDLAGIPYL